MTSVYVCVIATDTFLIQLSGWIYKRRWIHLPLDVRTDKGEQKQERAQASEIISRLAAQGRAWQECAPRRYLPSVQNRFCSGSALAAFSGETELVCSTQPLS
jgi:hypothetical protein